VESKKRLGIIGGMGSQAGAWLLQRILNLSRVDTDQDYPDILLHNNSSIPDRTQAILYQGQSPLPELKRSIEFFNYSGVDIVIIACMTAHFYFEELSRLSQGEILNAIDIVAAEICANMNYSSKKKLGIIGSTGLLKSGLFQKKMEALGYTCIMLSDSDQEEYFMKPIYMKGGIKSGIADEKVYKMFMHQVNILKAKGAELIIGACSEVPLVFTREAAIPVIDAFDLLARTYVHMCYKK
jgi:aspartate racemase